MIWSGCQRVGFRCRRISLGSLGQGWSGPTTNQVCMAGLFGGRRDMIDLLQYYSLRLETCFDSVRPLVESRHVLRNRFLRGRSFHRNEFPRARGCNNSMTESHRSSAGTPSIRKRASKERLPTRWCCVRSKLASRISNFLGKGTKMPSEVDLESSRSPAKSAP